mmetsp:Transcript_50007/g.119418  ORF Transcript_50007/g.119418 Transcript_50007/m.119418 type:complete len:220 (-) Transcript_50007:91-750(-)
MNVDEAVHCILDAICDRLGLMLHPHIAFARRKTIWPHQCCQSCRAHLEAKVGEPGLPTTTWLEAIQVDEDCGRSHRTIMMQLEELARLVAKHNKWLHLCQACAGHCCYSGCNPFCDNRLIPLQVYAGRSAGVPVALFSQGMVRFPLVHTMKVCGLALGYFGSLPSPLAKLDQVIHLLLRHKILKQCYLRILMNRLCQDLLWSGYLLSQTRFRDFRRVGF